MALSTDINAKIPWRQLDATILGTAADTNEHFMTIGNDAFSVVHAEMS
jgi:hypothetical protein